MIGSKVVNDVEIVLECFLIFSCDEWWFDFIFFVINFVCVIFS